MDSSGLRRSFLDFFKARQHALRPSAPLIPTGDPTLMFNSAGMVPFKPYFLGLKTDLKRASSCQKCFRTTDIERVGSTLRHMTFFEMLGNFSFGDYFKPEAVSWAWEFLTREMRLDPKRLHPTVFRDDEEALELWTRLKTPNPPTRLGEDSNFWAVGPTGPCGPCSEIYFDHGPKHSCGRPDCAVGCDCDRYLEIWNLVFMQFDRQEDGSLKPLPRKNIDTGMGLERLAFIVQGKTSPFDTDLFSPIVDAASALLGVSPRRDAAAAKAFRIIADHSRAAVMLAAEGVIPSNVDRGYVLRRLIRRAVRYGQLLGHDQAFLHKLVEPTIGIYHDAYPELSERRELVVQTLREEEQKFFATLVAGEIELNKQFSRIEGPVFPGETAFWLYETFGFPLELTRELAAERNISVDEDAFRRAQEKAEDIARASWKGSGERSKLGWVVPSAQTEFTGYASLEESTQVVAFHAEDSGGVLVLEKTPFYPEGGGQVGDQGQIWSEDGRELLAEVYDTQKQGSAILHLVRLRGRAPLAPGDKVLARVDAVRRDYIKPHHTATHLLNEALRRILGAHVRQAGSYVGADKLRFDFTHPKGLDSESLQKLEGLVASEIKRAEPVETKVDSIEKVKEYGAVTLLGEEYGERPRFVLIGPKGWKDPSERFSLELCGGTHVSNTSDIASFKILRESSVASGIRRIEAVAGKAVDDYERLRRSEQEQTVSQLMERQRELLAELTRLGGKAEESPPSQRDESRLRLREKELKELLARLKSQKLSSAAEAGRRTLEVSGVKLCVQRFEGAEAKQLRPLSDKIKSELGSGLVFLASPSGDKLSFVLSATPDLPGKGFSAERIAKAFASAGGGSAGGRPEFAQGGVKDKDWDEIVSSLCAFVRRD
ncbi:MAG: alanine--tRNA ligase [Elusimicrobia bacterium]|nr:alanine--tRNA ligase [Elusimicrobiota bacterium]